jgi:hypothetical protein
VLGIKDLGGARRETPTLWGGGGLLLLAARTQWGSVVRRGIPTTTVQVISYPPAVHGATSGPHEADHFGRSSSGKRGVNAVVDERSARPPVRDALSCLVAVQLSPCKGSPFSPTRPPCLSRWQGRDIYIYIYIHTCVYIYMYIHIRI